MEQLDRVLVKLHQKNCELSTENAKLEQQVARLQHVLNELQPLWLRAAPDLLKKVQDAIDQTKHVQPGEGLMKNFGREKKKVEEKKSGGGGGGMFCCGGKPKPEPDMPDIPAPVPAPDLFEVAAPGANGVGLTQPTPRDGVHKMCDDEDAEQDTDEVGERIGFLTVAPDYYAELMRLLESETAAREELESQIAHLHREKEQQRTALEAQLQDLIRAHEEMQGVAEGSLEELRQEMVFTERSLREQLRDALQGQAGNAELAMRKAELDKALSDEKFERHFEAFHQNRVRSAKHFERALGSVEAETSQVFGNLSRQIEVLKEQKQAEDSRFEKDLTTAMVNRTRGVASLQQKADCARSSMQELQSRLQDSPQPQAVADEIQALGAMLRGVEQCRETLESHAHTEVERIARQRQLSDEHFSERLEELVNGQSNREESIRDEIHVLRQDWVVCEEEKQREVETVMQERDRNLEATRGLLRDQEIRAEEAETVMRAEKEKARQAEREADKQNLRAKAEHDAASALRLEIELLQASHRQQLADSIEATRREMQDRLSSQTEALSEAIAASVKSSLDTTLKNVFSQNGST